MSTLPTRYLRQHIINDLSEKMVFLGGPKQVGKTTLAQSLLHEYQDHHPGYYNWDFEDHKKKIKDRSWPKNQRLIVLDEIHKLKGWRNLIKGFYDTLKNTHSFLITGSARLDHFRKGGDSLLGRYYYYRLHPYSLPELGGNASDLKRLMQFGGFPEPLLEQKVEHHARWLKQRLGHLIRTDLRDLENVKDLDKMYTLAEELPRRVGSPLSRLSLAHDLELDFKTIKRWLGILDSLYYTFQISPFGAPKIRAVKKEQKLYLWDWSQIEDQGARFENLVACHLLKFCHYHEDIFGHTMELRFIRDTDSREIDFVVIKNKKPLFAVECKLTQTLLSSALPYFKDRTNIPRFYQVHTGQEERQIDDRISIMPFDVFCRTEELI
jgi:predicted AAA+ superfamily ATPase